MVHTPLRAVLAASLCCIALRGLDPAESLGAPDPSETAIDRCRAGLEQSEAAFERCGEGLEQDEDQTSAIQVLRSTGREQAEHRDEPAAEEDAADERAAREAVGKERGSTGHTSLVSTDMNTSTSLGDDHGVCWASWSVCYNVFDPSKKICTLEPAAIMDVVLASIEVVQVGMVDDNPLDGHPSAAIGFVIKRLCAEGVDTIKTDLVQDAAAKCMTMLKKVKTGFESCCTTAASRRRSSGNCNSRRRHVTK